MTIKLSKLSCKHSAVSRELKSHGLLLFPIPYSLFPIPYSLCYTQGCIS
ncbi:MAG: hypothetical protein F6J90_00625 [Moorea sp. SIOASIH]|nr:hypothetical protein [Moorena sp. SIOASIH]NEO34888.1 hypothetical protein [Moorena sp. SIOASIH]